MFVHFIWDCYKILTRSYMYEDTCPGPEVAHTPDTYTQHATQANLPLYHIHFERFISKIRP